MSGHYGCGGVIAANSGDHYGQMDSWLDSIRNVRRENALELDKVKDKEKENDLLAELNVLKQCDNLIDIDFIRDSYKANGYPIVHAWIYNMRSGLLHDMEFDMESAVMKRK